MYINGISTRENLTGLVKHTYISALSEFEKVEINIQRKSGQANPKIYICVHDMNGTSQQRAEYEFVDAVNAKTKKFILNNVKGKMISVTLKGQPLSLYTSPSPRDRG